MHRVLVVEDDPGVREAVALVLEGAGYAVTAVNDGLGALAAATEHPRPDLIVLDLMLPGKSGFEVCREVRATSGVPIVMLTARADAADVVAGLELGADDYVTKPFVPIELAARIKAVLRRSADDAGSADGELRARDLTVDVSGHRAYRDGEEVPLTAMEHRLLTELVRDAGRVLTREVLLERVWGYDYLGDSRLVDMAIMRLREKLGPAPQPPDYVVTVRSVGYRFERG